jgi:hypothetical protein
MEYSCGYWCSPSKGAVPKITCKNLCQYRHCLIIQNICKSDTCPVPRVPNKKEFYCMYCISSHTTSTSYGIPFIVAAKTEMKLYIVRKAMLLIRNNGGSKFHTTTSVLPDYPETRPRRQSQNFKSKKLSQPLHMWLSSYDTETQPLQISSHFKIQNICAQLQVHIYCTNL